MTWRSRSLLVLPIALLLFVPPDAAWARGRGQAHGHHDHDHPSHHHVFGFGCPYGYAPCGISGVRAHARPGAPQSSAKEAPAAGGARGEAADGGERIRGEIDASVH